MKDKSGADLAPGQVIVYGHALGRCAGLQYGKVLEVQEKRVRVQGVDADWSHKAPRLMRPGFLYFGERILIVYSDQVPSEVMSILGEVKP